MSKLNNKKVRIELLKRLGKKEKDVTKFKGFRPKSDKSI